MTSLSLARVFQCLFKFTLIGGNLTAHSRGSLLRFPAPPPERPGELARRLTYM